MNDMLTHTVAAVILEILYLGTGILLCFIGQKLLVKGVEGRTKVEGDIAGGRWTLFTTSPGIVFAICGLTIIIYAIITPSMYEEKITEMKTSSGDEQLASGTSEKTTSVRSRLFDQSIVESPLRSLIVIYAIQHTYQGITNYDVTSEIKKMPTYEGAESFSKTYERFGVILKKNPKAILDMLEQKKFNWLVLKDKEDQTLSGLVEKETEKLSYKIYSNDTIK